MTFRTMLSVWNRLFSVRSLPHQDEGIPRTHKEKIVWRGVAEIHRRYCMGRGDVVDSAEYWLRLTRFERRVLGQYRESGLTPEEFLNRYYPAHRAHVVRLYPPLINVPEGTEAVASA